MMAIVADHFYKDSWIYLSHLYSISIPMSNEEKAKPYIHIEDDSSTPVQLPSRLSIMDPKQFPRISSILMKHVQGKTKLKEAREVKEQVKIDSPLKSELLAYFIYRQLPKVIEEKPIEEEEEVMLQLVVDDKPFVTLQDIHSSVYNKSNQLAAESVVEEIVCESNEQIEKEMPAVQISSNKQMPLVEEVPIEIEEEKSLIQQLKQYCQEESRREDPNRLMDEFEEQMQQVYSIQECQNEPIVHILMETNEMREEMFPQPIDAIQLQDKPVVNTVQNEEIIVQPIQPEHRSIEYIPNLIQNEAISMYQQKKNHCMLQEKRQQLDIQVVINESSSNIAPQIPEIFGFQYQKQEILPQITEILPIQDEVANPIEAMPYQKIENVINEQLLIQEDLINVQISKPVKMSQQNSIFIESSSPKQLHDSPKHQQQQQFDSGQYEALLSNANKPESQKAESSKKSNSQSPKNTPNETPSNPFTQFIKKKSSSANSSAHKNSEVIVIQQADEAQPEPSPAPAKTLTQFIPKTILNKRTEREQSIEINEKTVSTNPKQSQEMLVRPKNIIDNPDYNVNPMKLLLDLKNASLEDLRRSMSEYFPQNKEVYMNMQYDLLQKMLQVAMYELEVEAVKIQDKEMLAILQGVKEKVNVVVKQTENMENKQTGKIQKGKDEKNVSIEEMKNFLLKTMPELASTQLKDEKHLRILYDRAAKIHQENKEKKSKTKKTKDQPIKRRLNYHQILEICAQKFPYLKEDLKKLTEQEIRKIYEEIQGTIQPPTHSKAISHPPEQTIDRVTQSSTLEKANGKRTHEDMMSYKKGEQKKKKVNITDIRNKLIGKMPNYKDTIMKFNDQEIEKLYMESAEKTSDREKDKVKKSKNSAENGGKGDVCAADEANHKKKTGDTKQSQFKEVLNTQIGGGKTKVYEIKDNKKKKNRTVIFVHTEEQDSDREGDQMSKTFQTEGGKQKRGVCACCKKLDVNDLIYELLNRLPKE